MSGTEQRAAQGDLLMRFYEARDRFGLLQAEASKIAKELEGFAAALRKHPTFTARVPEDWAAIGDKIANLLTDLSASREDVIQLKSQADAAGLGRYTNEQK